MSSLSYAIGPGRAARFAPVVIVAFAVLGPFVEGQRELPPYDATACSAARHAPSIVVNGSAPGDHMGSAIDCSADWDGDGFDDVLAAGGAELGTGRVWLLFGPDLSSSIEFVIPGFKNQLTHLGPTAAFIGDVNGGGRVDIAIGDPYWTNTQGTPDTSDDVHDAGRVLVFFGEDSPLPGSVVTLDDQSCDPDIVIEHDGPGPMWFGASVAGGNVAGSYADPCASPVSTQQYSDLIVGAPVREDVKGLPGQVFVFLGGPHDPTQSPPLLALAGPCGAAGQCPGQTKPIVIQATQCAYRQITGLLPRDRFGFSVAATGDISPTPGYGYQSVLIGAPQGEFLVSGGLTQFIDAFTDVYGQVLPGYAEVWSAMHHWVVLPIPVESGKVVSLFGWAVSRAGDLDGDGIEDLLVGAPGYGDPALGPAVNVGAVYAFSGRLDPYGSYPLLAGPITLAALKNATDAPGAGDALGFSIAGRKGHDVDGDGRDDLVVGLNVATNPEDPADTCGCDPTSGLQSGRAYIIGLEGNALNPHALAVYRGEARRDGFGWAVSIGNIFHLGTTSVPDVVCGAPRNSTICSGGTEDGELDVFAGENVVVP